jgi:hypothetical protein
MFISNNNKITRSNSDYFDMLLFDSNMKKTKQVFFIQILVGGLVSTNIGG